MILFIFFLSFLLGSYIKLLPFILPVILIAWIIFIFKRHGKNIAIVSTLLAVIGFGVSFLGLLFTPKNSCSGFVYESKANYYLLYSGGQRFYVYNKNNSYEIGDYLSITGEAEKLDFTTIESQFDFENFLNNKGVIYQYNVKSIKLQFKNPLRIRSIRENFLKHFDSDTSSFIRSILFNEYEENEVNKFGDILHLGRFMSTSGVYIYAFMGLFTLIYSFLVKKKYAEILSLITLTPFIVLSMPNLTVIRILFMFVAKWINTYFLNKKFEYLTILTFVAIILTFFNRYIIYSDGFILGFSIPIIFRIASHAFRKIDGIKKKLLTSLVVYFYFIPFEIKYYNSINLLSFPLSFLLSPLFIVIGVISLLTLYGIPIYVVPKWLISGLTNILRIFSKIPLEIYCSPINENIVIILVIIFLVFLYYLDIQFKPFYRPIGIILMSIYCLNCLPIKNIFTNQVSFINVGQGDCCLIRNQFNTILIDTGGLTYTDIANDCLIPYFKKNRIYNIDLLITTHDDFDHMGAAKTLQTDFRVKKYVTSYSDFPITIGNITFNNYNTFINQIDDKNESSLVIGFNICNKDFLITGDAPIEIEKKIMITYSSIKCDVLKVGHHGSKTSTSDAFIKYLSPKEAIISVGKKNKYGHPDKSVIDILKRNNVVIKRTDIMGTISYTTFAF